MRAAAAIPRTDRSLSGAFTGVGLVIFVICALAFFTFGLGVERADAALINNIAKDHLGDFGSRNLDELLGCKWIVSRAVRKSGTLVLNADDPMAAATRTEARQRHFSISGPADAALDGDELVLDGEPVDGPVPFEAGQALVETYGVKVDQALHREVLERVEPLDIAPYKGFIQAELVPVEDNIELLDIVVEYPDDFASQMLNYEENYSFLPVSN